MRFVKIGIWTFIIFLIQTVVLSQIKLYSAAMSLVVPYIVCVMLMEDDTRTAYIISAICSAAAGALCSHQFVVTVLYLFYTSLAVFGLRDKPVYVHDTAKAIAWTFVISGIGEIVSCILGTGTLTVDVLLYAALPTAIINTVFVIVIYPLLKRTIYKEEKKKLLIGDLV